MFTARVLSCCMQMTRTITRNMISQCESKTFSRPPMLLAYMSNFTRSYGVDSKTGVSSPIWKIGKLNHVAIAVPDIEKATALYRDVLGATVSEKVALPDHGVYTVFVELDNTKIELLLPYGEKSPIQSFLDKNKSGGLHHICLEVNDIEAAIADVKDKGIRTLTEGSRIGAHGKPVIFLHPKDCNGVLVELEQV